MKLFRSVFSVKDRSENPAPEDVYNWRLYFLVFSAVFGSGCYGYDGGFIGSTIVLESFRNRFGLSDNSNLSSNIVSTFQAGAFFGAFFSYFVNRRLGRKPAILIVSGIFEIGLILQVAAGGRISMIYAGRVLNGLSVGTFSALIPLYISEWSPPSIRGICVGSYEVCYQTFLLIGFWINYGTNKHISSKNDAQWQLPFAFQLVPCTLVLVLMFFQPESYRFLLKRGKKDKAIKNLCKIRQLGPEHPYIQWEIECAETQIMRENSVGIGFRSELRECFKKGVRERIGLAIAVMVLQNTSGINALNYYSNSIFKAIGFTGTDTTLMATGVFGVIKCVTNVLAIFIGTEKFGRRNLIIYGTIGTSICMLYLTVYTAVSGSFNHTVPRDAGAYFAMLAIYFFAFFFTGSWNAVPFIYCSEILSSKVRDIGMAIAAMWQWLMQFVIVYSNPYMMRTMKWGTFLFFAGWLIFSIFFCYFFMPETRGISLEDMDYIFSAKGFAITRRKEAERIIAELRENRDDYEDAKPTDDQVEEA